MQDLLSKVLESYKQKMAMLGWGMVRHKYIQEK